MPKSQLLELYAHGLGVIQEARLEFGSGFNVLTGETGAGKTCSWAPSILSGRRRFDNARGDRPRHARRGGL